MSEGICQGIIISMQTRETVSIRKSPDCLWNMTVQSTYCKIVNWEENARQNLGHVQNINKIEKSVEKSSAL